MCPQMAPTEAQYHHGSVRVLKTVPLKQLPGMQASYSAASRAKQSGLSFWIGLPTGKIQTFAYDPSP